MKAIEGIHFLINRDFAFAHFPSLPGLSIGAGFDAEDADAAGVGSSDNFLAAASLFERRIVVSI